MVKKLDEAVSKNSDCRMGSFVIMLSDDDKMEDKLKAFIKKENIKKVVIAIDNPQGPPKWEIAKDADVTVLFYTKRTVKKNFAFEKGKMTEKDIETIIAELKTVLPEKSEK